MTTGTRLAIGGAVVASVTGYMAYLGAASSWQYYVTVDECAAGASSLVGHPLRVSGRVVPSTLQINDIRSHAWPDGVAGIDWSHEAEYSQPCAALLHFLLRRPYWAGHWLRRILVSGMSPSIRAYC